jgi:hypothetical protein
VSKKAKVTSRFRVGDKVVIPSSGPVLLGEIVEVWGDAHDHVRVSFWSSEEDDGPTWVLMPADILTAA